MNPSRRPPTYVELLEIADQTERMSQLIRQCALRLKDEEERKNGDQLADGAEEQPPTETTPFEKMSLDDRNQALIHQTIGEFTRKASEKQNAALLSSEQSKRTKPYSIEEAAARLFGSRS